ncbi:very short patch repair endonuclease [Luteimonas saliphila]|uniref:very short patch repair endonuclease n=1 Tax=Luteimonas saliphila TaxID=2804919 RepID=UPI003CCDFF29
MSPGSSAAGLVTRPFKSRSLAHLVTTAQRSEHMGRVRRSGTAAELNVREALRALGIRFTVENGGLLGSPDIANRTRRFVIFVHGCYWHRHPGCARATIPSRNSEFWQAKFDANVRRDRRVARLLRRDGYKVITIWECKTRDPGVLARRLKQALAM